MSHFYLTLPSNSSAKYFPENTAAHFWTKLSKSYTLDGQWEVGLSSIVFPSRFGHKPIDSFSFKTFYFKNYHSLVGGFEHKIRGGVYASGSDLVDELNRQLRKPFREVVQEGRMGWNKVTKFRYDATTRKIFLNMTPALRMEFPNELAKLMGMEQNVLVNEDADEDFLYESPNPCELDAEVSAMYVYCDLIEEVPVGDSMVPLLAICDTQSTYGWTVHRRYEKPMYVPLKKRDFDTLEIDIRTNTGDPMPFLTGPLVVTLHFRKAKNTYLF